MSDYWIELSALALERYGDTERGLRFARMMHKELTGEWGLDTLTPGGQCTDEMRLRVDAARESYFRRKAAMEAKLGGANAG